MVEIYLTGVFIAFCIGLMKCCISFSTANSIRYKNLNQINIFYDILSGGVILGKPPKWKLFFYLPDVLILGPLLSWITVVHFVFIMINRFLNKPPIPERIKEIQYKVATINLPKDEIIKLLRESSDFLGVNDELLDEIEGESHTLSKTDEYGWYFELKVDPKFKTYSVYQHTPDYDSEFKSKAEYKIDGYDVFVRLLEDQYQHMGDKDYTFNVRDNVVFESEIRRQYAEEKFSTLASIEEKLNGYKKQIEWQPMLNYEIKYFILSKHPEINSKNDFRKFLRQEKEKLDQGIEKFKVFKSKYQSVLEDRGDISFLYKDDVSEDVRNEINNKYEEFMKINNLNWDELANSEDIFANMAKYLSG